LTEAKDILEGKECELTIWANRSVSLVLLGHRHPFHCDNIRRFMSLAL